MGKRLIGAKVTAQASVSAASEDVATNELLIETINNFLFFRIA
jgi:hypothetical protein